MARNLVGLLHAEGELLALTPLHVGGAGDGDISDMPVAVDGLGRPYLPGTSIAGALRQWDESALPDPAGSDDELWGFVRERHDAGCAARLRVDDAPAIGAAPAELWHGVGMDRRTGGAFRGIKFDREVLPAGTRFALRLSLEARSAATLAQDRARLARLLAALQAGAVTLGAAGTRGLGRVRLEKLRAREVDLGSRAGLLAHLRGAGDDAWPRWQQAAGLDRDGLPGGSAAAQAGGAPRLRIRIDWRPRGALMSKAAWDGTGTDMLPFLSRVAPGRWALTLAGSGIKGALRQQAERIVRSLLRQDFAIDDSQHHGQVDVPLVRELFGRARPRRNAQAGADTGAAADHDTTAGRGLLAVASCYSRLQLTDEELAQLDRGDDLRPRGLHRADHVAIDRWTGGAAESFLYNAIEPLGLQWQPIELTLDLGRLPGAGCDRDALLALLLLLLDDLAAGRIPLGFGVNRGYGDIEVQNIALSGLDHLLPGLPAECEVRRPLGELPALREALAGGWQRWIETHENPSMGADA